MQNDMLKSLLKLNLKSSAFLSLFTGKFDLNLTQIQIMFEIKKGFGKISELKRVLGFTQPAITKQVDILVKKEFVLKVIDANDKRVFHLFLTKEGSKTLKELNNSISLNHLDDREITELYNSIKSVNTIINKLHKT